MTKLFNFIYYLFTDQFTNKIVLITLLPSQDFGILPKILIVDMLREISCPYLIKMNKFDHFAPHCINVGKWKIVAEFTYFFLS